MSSLDVKGDLHDYLRGARGTLVWKLDGLGEYDVRRPLTGTNLLGLVKHDAGVTSSRWTPSDECGGGETVRSPSTAFSST